MNSILFAAALAATNTVVSAQTPTIVVEASRIGKYSMEMPANVQVITREEISSSGAKDIVGVLQKRTTALNIIQTGAGNPALSQFAMPGYGENGFGRTLVMVDGQRLNYSDMAAPLLTQINLGSVERVEILQGSQNVLHGDGASAGMINIVTIPEDYATHGHLEVHGGSFDTFGANASLRGGDEESGMRYWGNGGWEKSSGYRANNGWDLYHLGGGLSQDFSNGASWKISSAYNYSKYDLPGYLTGDWKHHARETNSPYDAYKRETVGITAALCGVINEENRVKLDMSFSNGKMNSRQFSAGSYTDYDPNNFWAPTPVDYTDDYYMTYDICSYQFTPCWINESDILGFSQEFITGLDYRFDRLHGKNKDVAQYTPDFWYMTGTTLTKYEYNRETAGYFAQDTFHLTEEVAFQLGGRYSRVWNENTALISKRRVDNVYACDAALLFNPTDDLKTYIRFSRFYRNAFLDENPYVNYVADSILKPETGYSIDVGGDYRHDDFFVFANVFASKTKNEIMYDKFYFGTNFNYPADVMREGFTLGGGWEKERVADARIAYTFVDARFDGGEFDDKKVPMCATSTVALNGRYWLLHDFNVFGGYRYMSYRHAYSDMYNEGRKLPGYGIFHLGFQYAPSCAMLEGWTFTLTVDNLFDKRYADCATRSASGYEVYYPAAGRSLFASVRYEF